MENLSQFREWIDSTGLSLTALARKVGTTHGTLSKLRDGRHRPSFDLILQILVSYPRLNARWLITGEGGMYDSYESDLDVSVFREPQSPYSTNPTIREFQLKMESLTDLLAQCRDQLRDRERIIELLEKDEKS